AEVRYTQSNKAVAQFSLAVNRPGNKETDFINIIAWDKLGEIVQKYTHKGSLIAVEGRLQTRTYEDNNGNKKYITEVVANNINLLEPKNKQEQTENNYRQVDKSDPFEEMGKQVEQEINDNDLPF
ncbi:MAG: single-stranded DNA-binding protein, partial [Bacilli bacterium]|nr:single-stranded DNA-binding protein [Bacilli bacterium]